MGLIWYSSRLPFKFTRLVHHHVAWNYLLCNLPWNHSSTHTSAPISGGIISLCWKEFKWIIHIFFIYPHFFKLNFFFIQTWIYSEIAKLYSEPHHHFVLWHPCLTAMIFLLSSKKETQLLNIYMQIFHSSYFIVYSYGFLL
jgi:hypothetical protein